MSIATVTTSSDPRELALLKAVGLDRLAPEQRALAMNIAERYGLDLLLKHLVMIEGRPYITRDGLLHIAHRSGQLDGIEVTAPEVIDGFWRSTCSVYRKDMARPFTYTGRYPTSGGNQKFAPEMATKVGEVMALRRAFDVAAPTLEERWDIEVPAEATEKPKPVTLAERVAEKAATVAPEAATATESPVLVEGSPEWVADVEGIPQDIGGCGWRVETKAGLVDCDLPEQHEGPHSWTDLAVKQGGKVIRPPE